MFSASSHRLLSMSLLVLSLLLSGCVLLSCNISSTPEANIMPTAPHANASPPYNTADSVVSRVERLGSKVFGAIKTDGSLWVWGENSYGEIGNGTYDPVDLPTNVLENVNTASGGTYHSIALLNDGTLWVWGALTYDIIDAEWETITPRDTASSPIQLLSNVRSILAGRTYTYALKEEGSLWVWGANDYGMLGFGDTLIVDKPTLLLENVILVDYGLALRTDGSLWAWGAKSWDDETMHEPYLVMINVAVIGHDFHQGTTAVNSYAVDENGNLWVWGSNTYGQLGNGTTSDFSNSPYKALENVTSFVIRDGTSYAITREGYLYTWGRNDRGQVGDGGNVHRSSPYMVADEVVSIQVLATASVIALRNDGSVWVWGYYEYLQGDLTSPQNPLVFYSPKHLMNDIKFLSSGSNHYHAMALSSDGTLYSWGMLDIGGTEIIRPMIYQSSPMKLFERILAFNIIGLDAYAVTTDGSLLIWNASSYDFISTGTLNYLYKNTMPSAFIYVIDNFFVREGNTPAQAK